MTKSTPTSLSNALLTAAKLDDRYTLDTIKARAVEAFDQWLLYDTPDPTGPQPRGRIAQIAEDALPDIDRMVLELLSDHAQLLVADATVSVNDMDQTLICLLKDELVNGTGGLVHAWETYCGQRPHGGNTGGL
jgi:hypothetical protein